MVFIQLSKEEVWVSQGYFKKIKDSSCNVHTGARINYGKKKKKNVNYQTIHTHDPRHGIHIPFIAACLDLLSNIHFLEFCFSSFILPQFTSKSWA